MKSKVLIAVVSLISSVALAKEPLVQVEAPPATDAWFGYTLGVQYEYSDMDIDLENGEQSFDIRAVYGTFTVPLSPKWDFLLRLGGANASTNDFDGRTEWAWGMGLHAIIASWDELSLEAKGQITSVTASKPRTVTVFDAHGDPNYFRGDDELSLFEYNLMVGPTWSHGPLSLSAGAMARYMTGDFAYYGSPTQDVDHDLRIGGYVGASFDVTDAIGIFGDVQADEQLNRFSAGLLWRL
jgi:hypothetical protein